MTEPVVTQIPAIVDASGNPLSSSYKGARSERDLRNWSPPRRSADKDLLHSLPQLQARSYDLDRNYALTSGAHQISVDNVIGTGLTINPNPNHHILGWTPEQTKEWRKSTKQKFLNWANDESSFIDAGRRWTLSDLFALAYRSELTTGEQLAVAEWLPRRGSQFSTAISIIDPMRLENPQNKPNEEGLRAGVYLGKSGNPVAYSFRMGSDINYNYKWKKVQRENRFGRQNVFHHFDAKRPGQSRGVTAMASIIAKSKMLERFQEASLESAIVNSMYAAYIKSSMPQGDVAGALGAVDGKSYTDQLTEVMAAKASVKDGSYVNFDGGVKIPHLLPDEEFEVTSLNHPGPNFEQFERSMIRHLASGLGLSYEQLARDYKDTNYSGARSALMESWKFFTSRRANSGRFGSWIYTLWLEESIDKGVVEVPNTKGQRPIEFFWENKAALTRCSWRGNAKGHIDPLKETRADNEEVDNFMGTLEEKNASRNLDWEEVIDQRMIETKAIKDAAERHGLSAEDLSIYGSGSAQAQIMSNGETN